VKPTQLTLPNGLVATIHSPRSRLVRDLLKNCVNRNEIFTKPNSLFALEIEIENEHIYLVYWVAFKTPESLITDIQRNFEYTLQLNNFVIYNNVAYFFLSQTHAAFVTSIIQKVKPSIAALISNQGGEKNGPDNRKT